jgi:uncharacterized RDD family membrane protein YckC
MEQNAAAPVMCPQCGAANIASARFCSKCGIKLREISNLELRYATFGERLAAFIFNLIIVLLMTALLTHFIDLIFFSTAARAAIRIDEATISPEGWIVIWIWFGTFFGFGILYSALCTGLWGRTVGKMLIKLKVLKSDGSRVSISRAFVRSLAYQINQFSWGLTFIMIPFTGKKQGLHDYIANTIVVKTK